MINTADDGEDKLTRSNFLSTVATLDEQPVEAEFNPYYQINSDDDYKPCIKRDGNYKFKMPPKKRKWNELNNKEEIGKNKSEVDSKDEIGAIESV